MGFWRVANKGADKVNRRELLRLVFGVPLAVMAGTTLTPIWRQRGGRWFRCRMYELKRGDVFVRAGSRYRATSGPFEVDQLNMTAKVWAVEAEVL